MNEMIMKNAHEIALSKAAEHAKELTAEHGDSGACGFAWVTVYPEHKGNTKLGKEERRILESLGYRKDYTGKGWELWNPSKAMVQSVYILEKGAEKYKSIFKTLTGLERIYANSRLD